MRPITAVLFFLFLASTSAQTGSVHSIQVSEYIQPASPIEIKPAVGGRVKKLHVHPGDEVKAGDLLIEIDAPLEEEKSMLNVTAPVGGTILTVPVFEGQMVIASDESNLSTTLMTFADLSKLFINAHVPQAEVAKLAAQQSVQFGTDLLPGEQMQATISFISPIATVENNVKGFHVQAVIEKPDPRLRPGMVVELALEAK